MRACVRRESKRDLAGCSSEGPTCSVCGPGLSLTHSQTAMLLWVLRRPNASLGENDGETWGSPHSYSTVQKQNIHCHFNQQEVGCWSITSNALPYNGQVRERLWSHHKHEEDCLRLYGVLAMWMMKHSLNLQCGCPIGWYRQNLKSDQCQSLMASFTVNV